MLSCASFSSFLFLPLVFSFFLFLSLPLAFSSFSFFLFLVFFSSLLCVLFLSFVLFPSRPLPTYFPLSFPPSCLVPLSLFCLCGSRHFLPYPYSGCPRYPQETQ